MAGNKNGACTTAIHGDDSGEVVGPDDEAIELPWALARSIGLINETNNVDDRVVARMSTRAGLRGGGGGERDKTNSSRVWLGSSSSSSSRQQLAAWSQGSQQRRTRLLVSCSVAPTPPRCLRIEVQPASVDDWEVIEAQV